MDIDEVGLEAVELGVAEDAVLPEPVIFRFVELGLYALIEEEELEDELNVVGRRTAQDSDLGCQVADALPFEQHAPDGLLLPQDIFGIKWIS